ncbi:zinc-dependent metalloprotease [Psychroserpens sp.]|uniref:zinc-dependent metalloprotease n=1 Tax=Psychroserpens sp. TaxID=2020870 RepID=UPI002B272015|nr:zinc-dependent metalloprotease [Psychroserpens sp.]
MTSKSVLIFLAFIFVSFFSYSQECGFDEEQNRLSQNPDFLRQQEQFEEKIQNFIASEDMQNRMGGVLTIPVVVHVLHLGEAVGSGTNIADAQIQSSIDNLNDFYRGITPGSPLDFEIEFTLAQRDPNCNATTGINRIDASAVPNYSSDGVSFLGAGADETVLKDLSRWPETDYFNVWIVTEIDGNNGGGGFQGYANFFNGNAYEGSVMMHSVFGYDPTNANPSWPLNFARDNSTVVHEAGHYFHLYHTFQGDDTNNDGISDACPADVTVGVNSDGCADTVPHQRETSTCPANNACTSNPWVDDNTINNIMSYYWCTDLMTNDQKTRVRAAMEGTSLVNSKGSQPVDPSYAAPVAVCSTNSPAANNFAGIYSVELNGVTFSSSTTGIDGGNIDNSGNCSNYFEIDASISNTLNVGVGNNFNQIGVWIDWNDDGDFDDDAEQQHFSQDIAAFSIVPIVLTYPTTIPYNDYVRVRIIEDLDDRYTGVDLINSSCYSFLEYGQSEDYAIYIMPATGPTTYTYNNGWSPSDPNGVATASEDIVIAVGNATINSNTTCNSLTVNAGAGLTINSATTLTVANDLTLESSSTSYSSLILDGSIIGTINYERHVNINGSGTTGSNDLISAPVTGQAFNAFATANPNILNNGTLYLFGPFDKTTGTYLTYAGTATTTLDPGVGYRAASSDNGSFTFTGTANTTLVSVDILNSGPSEPAEQEWNLVGNPYPSYLNVQAFLNHEVSTGVSNLNLMNAGTAAIYGYDGNALDDWTIYNLANTTASTVITPGQGFFVSADATNAPLYDLEFTPAMRSTGTSDDFIVGRSANNTNSILSTLQLSSSTKTTNTSIYFIEGTTRGLDPGYDAASYHRASGELSIFTNLIEDNEGLDIAIQSIPYNDFNDVTIPLGIKAPSGTLLSIGLDDKSSLPANIKVYLEDTFKNTLTLLNESDYTFIPSNDLVGTGRFYLRYSAEHLSLDTNDDLNNLIIYINENYKDIIIKGKLTSASKVDLYDIQGRLVLSSNLEESSVTNSVDVSSISAGVYIIQVSNSSNTITKKLIIK